MAGNSNNQSEGLGDDFLEQMLAGGEVGGPIPMGLQLGSGGGPFRMGMGLPLGLNLEQSFLRHDHDRFREDTHHHHHHHFQAMDPTNASSPTANNGPAITERDSVHMGSLFPAFGQLGSPALRAPPPPAPQLHQPFHVQATSGGVSAPPQPPSIRPRVRARRGQATDPHSIAERLRRERIAERMKALQELVPSCNKTDRAAMLDEIVDYVKFLRLQVKVLSMSRLGGAGAVAQLVADVPLSSIEGDANDSGNGQPAWDKWSTDGTEQQVAKLMEEDVGAAMQFLQSKALCIMPISLASAIFQTHQTDTSGMVKPESNNSS